MFCFWPTSWTRRVVSPAFAPALGAKPPLTTLYGCFWGWIPALVPYPKEVVKTSCSRTFNVKQLLVSSGTWPTAQILSSSSLQRAALSSTTLVSAASAALGVAAAVKAVLVWLPWPHGLCAQSNRARCCNKGLSASSLSPATPLNLSACGQQWGWPTQLRGASWAPSD